MCFQKVFDNVQLLNKRLKFLEFEEDSEGVIKEFIGKPEIKSLQHAF